MIVWRRWAHRNSMRKGVELETSYSSLVGIPNWMSAQHDSSTGAEDPRWMNQSPPVCLSVQATDKALS